VQAHPTVPCAKRLFNSPVGKTECWYFLPGTAPDACVYLGFKPGITREVWEEVVMSPANTGDITDFLHRIPFAPGDFVFVDGGVPHAIGGGCFMIELQEPSDLMVVAERFTPSGRRIPDAKMHGGVGWDKMFDVYEYEGRTYEETCAKYVRRGCASARICGPEFTDKFEMWRIADGGTVALDGASAVVVVTDGDGLLNDHPASRGDRIIVSGESILCSRGTLSAVVCFLP
jgi:mannose-6-phosphate isomerase